MGSFLKKNALNILSVLAISLFSIIKHPPFDEFDHAITT